MPGIRTTTRRTAREVEQRGRQIATNPKFIWVARLGYLARAVVYWIIGALGITAAVSHRAQTPSVRGALRDLIHAPLGHVLLLVVGTGLLAFAAWRAVQAVADTDRRGSGVSALLVRAGRAISAIIHALLAVYAGAIVFGWHAVAAGADVSGNIGAQSWSAWLLSKPAGWVALGVVGGIIIGIGISQIVIAWLGWYRRHLAIGGRKERWLDPVCKFGLIALGIAFVLVGIFVVLAALQSSPTAARGFGGALQSLLAEPFGTVLLFVVALGLIAFGVYSLIEAVYHRFASAQN